MKKRFLINNAIYLILFIAATSCKSFDSGLDQSSELLTLKPTKLKKGDTIGLVSPAGFISHEQLDEAKSNLEKLGFKVKYTDTILKKYGYLAGSDLERTEDLQNMFIDKDVDAIMAIRGGYGCARILPLLNYDLLKSNPKIIIGYSDITSLLYAIYAKTGLVGFHGPVGTSTFNEYSVNHFENVLLNPTNTYEMKNMPKDEEQLVVINEGIAEGKLVGGNLSIVVSMIGTEYDIDTKGKIIFLEEIDEKPYRIDRMLTQMKQSGKFDNCSGVALGVFRKCDIDENDPKIEKSLTLQQVLRDVFSDLKIPVIYGLSFGHIENKFTLPFGINARLDTYKKSLTLLEKAVE